MHRTMLAFIVAALPALLDLSAAGVRQSGQPWIADQRDGTYRNPVLYADYSDPDVIRVGRDYYLVASSFNAVPGLPILHSTDLVNWTLIGHALPRLAPETLFSTPQHGKGPWAPALRHRNGKFWIYYPEPDLGLFVTTAANPAGPWSEPVLVKGAKGAIDPCPFWDDDGQGYLVHAWARSRAGFANVLTLNRLTPDGLHSADEGRIVINGDALTGYRTLEGPKLYKRGDIYWIFAPAGGVKTGWQSAFRAKSIDGPYEDRIVMDQGTTDVNGPHQGAWVDTPAGEDWFLHFQDLDAYGRVVHLQPMKWRDDGWPVIGLDSDGDGKGEPVRTWRKPAVGETQAIASPPTSDEFNEPRLGLQWQWQANPRDLWLSYTAKPGSLRLFSQPLPAADSLFLAPNLLLQKWPAPSFAVTAALTFAPASATEGETAGLIVFGQDYAWVGLRGTAGQMRVVMRVLTNAREGGSEREVASIDAQGAAVYLRVAVTDGAKCRFSFSADNRRFTPIGEEFTAKPGVWVGAKVGVFAAALPDAAKMGYADWDWIRVTAGLAAGVGSGGIRSDRSLCNPCKTRWAQQWSIQPTLTP
jgi:beta-xylosidase